MKYIFQLLLTIFPVAMMAQDKGIHFEHELSWTEVQAKAKAENKYIFVDCFTTWCGPCKMMSANVFPQEEVGTFFNKNFISVKVQMDKTAGDKEEIKKWYGDAKMIADQYEITAFPTFLYFSPEGKLIHRVIGGGDAQSFIAKSAAALDPAKQYFTMLESYMHKSDKTPADIRNMAIVAKDNGDAKNAGLFKNQYLATQKDLYTKENLEFIIAFTEGSKDKEFEMFLKNGDQIDQVMGARTATQKINSIILKEEVFPNISADESAAATDWAAIRAAATKKYPAHADEPISSLEVRYYRYQQDWKNFLPKIGPYMKKYGNTVAKEELNNFASLIFEHSSDPKYLSEALEWSKSSFNDKENPKFMDTYANLLYKLGKKRDAIAWQEKAVALAEGDQVLKETLDKMKKGEKTWKD